MARWYFSHYFYFNWKTILKGDNLWELIIIINYLLNSQHVSGKFSKETGIFFFICDVEKELLNKWLFLS